MATLLEERHTAIHLLRAVHGASDVAQQLNRTPRWVRKWRKRFEEEGWQGLQDRSRAPRRHGTRLPDTIRQAIAQARSELEAEAEREDGLKYIGAMAVRTKLRGKKVNPWPSVSTIERVLREREMTRPYRSQSRQETQYPRLHANTTHQLCQVDIVPHFLTGGERVSCFNAIGVVSRYPTGQAYAQRRSLDAVEFLIHVCQTVGIARYTQVDNEGCFSGGFTHPYVVGKFARAALYLGTELVFSPTRHPQSNGFVERFHQDYNRHVWEATYLDSRDTVQRQADRFFALYRDSGHHTELKGRTPHEVHHETTPHRLASDFCLPGGKLPIYEGRIHFMRCIQPDGTISVLNVDWQVPNASAGTGVWATVEFRCTGATISVYDAAPDALERTCLATYPFPLSEPVLPWQPSNRTASVDTASTSSESRPEGPAVPPDFPLLPAPMPTSESAQMSVALLLAALKRTAQSAGKLIRGTMY